MKNCLRVHDQDNVAVALEPLAPGADALHTRALDSIPAGHKIALEFIGRGEPVIKYGQPIGVATQDIQAGEWVHTHNLVSALGGTRAYTYKPVSVPVTQAMEGTFLGYMRPDGRVGTRNEVWILPTVGCVAHTAQMLAERARAAFGFPVYAFSHPYGCSQLGEDHERTRQLLAALARHPNAGGVLLLGLGCENNHMAGMLKALGDAPAQRIRTLVTQDVQDELETGLSLLEELVGLARQDVRTPQPVSRLVIGLKCGGSDGLSGLTANPLLGRVSDALCAAGGRALLTEVPEMFGAEELLMARCADKPTFEATVRLINDYKEYFERYGQPVSENPSPGNREGGITTLEEKSLGCVQKGGTSRINDVLEYAAAARRDGLSLVFGPGNDLCAVTALCAAGAQLILFTTGRGTPLGSPVPVLKLSTNSDLAARKPGWVDFDAGSITRGARLEDALIGLVLETASGAATLSERAGYRDLAIFKDGVIE